MKNLLIITVIIFLFGLNIFAQQYEFQAKNRLLSNGLGGYVRDISFYNDTCYILTGKGTIMVRKSDGGVIQKNYFSSISLHNPTKLYVDDQYLIVLEDKQISYYSKKGVFVKKTTMGSLIPWYLWVKNKSEILVVSQEGVTAYNYPTGMYNKRLIPQGGFKGEHFIGYKDKIYNTESTLRSFKWENDYLSFSDLTTFEYQRLYKENYFLACFIDNGSLWFKYYERDKLYVMDNGFNIVGTYPLLKSSEKPTDDELYIESGIPNLKFYNVQNKIYIVNIKNNALEFNYLMIK